MSIVRRIIARFRPLSPEEGSHECVFVADDGVRIAAGDGMCHKFVYDRVLVSSYDGTMLCCSVC
jgi:hypothetical protein